MEQEQIDRMNKQSDLYQKYLDNRDHTATLLLDMLRVGELNQKEYNQMVKDLESNDRQWTQ